MAWLGKQTATVLEVLDGVYFSFKRIGNREGMVRDSHHTFEAASILLVVGFTECGGWYGGGVLMMLKSRKRD